MKISESWLREWINPALTSQQLAALLTMAGLEVDALVPAAGDFSQVIVAEVLSTTTHPDAEKLTVCTVNIGQEMPIQIICGANNVRPGLKTACALSGAVLPGDLQIKETMLRGQLSQGMLCSLEELGVSFQAEGIVELEQDAPVGTDLRAYLQLDDLIFDIDLTPNRADCLSVMGIARELAALCQMPCKPLPNKTLSAVAVHSMQITMHAAEACPRYEGRSIRGINPYAKTPRWLAERIRRSGLRTIHPVVDVTNYVMLELGQPMHAFDLAAIRGGLQIRFAKENESIELLNGEQLALKNHTLVIADQDQALAIAGIMGSESSGVQENTTDIFLESAFFTPKTIATAARAYGLQSDSSQRFERGVDPQLAAVALEYATFLLLNIVGGEAEATISISNPQAYSAAKIIPFRPQRVKQLCGVDITFAQMQSFLLALGMKIEEENQALWQVAVPSHRFDITIEEDLIEEIIRLHGYDNITGTPLFSSAVAGKINTGEQLLTTLNYLMMTLGYQETISYSFVDPQLQQELFPDQQTMQLLNPISSELSQMRLSMWPGLLAAMIYNIHRQQNAIQFFEQGVTFTFENGQLVEKNCLAGLLTGDYDKLNWGNKARKFDFYDAKGHLQTLFKLLHIEVEFVSAAHSALHPGKSAQLLYDNKIIGWCGSLHPKFIQALNLNEEVIVFELQLLPLQVKQTPVYQSISKFPQIRRDLSLLVDVDVTAKSIETVVRRVVPATILKQFAVFDVYSGESIAKDKKSLAIALILQDDKRTMIDDEINALISAIIKALATELTIQLRE